ncbi:MAG: hypothetical protein ABFS41_17020, partial [Myxococcota bacterium]
RAMVSSAFVTRTFAALLLPFVLPLAAAAQDPPPAAASDTAVETWYTERIITGAGSPGVEHLWSKGPWMRSELVVAGQPIVQIVKDDRYVIVNRLQRRGIAIQRNPEAIRRDASRRRTIGDDREIILAAGGEETGDGEVGGQPCTVYRLTDGDGRRETCVSTSEAHVPLRTVFWHRASNRSTEIRYLTWASKVPLTDDFFEVAPDVAIESYGYEQYLEASQQGPVGPAPATFSHLLHGR